jgi:pimeloyl-ACP methyl ester carboxylesterase
MQLKALLLAALLALPATASAAAPQESAFEAPGPGGALKGTLLRPGDAGRKDPVVLIVPGSGPTDRDGNNVLGVKGSPYKLLAQALLERGVSVGRYDKRGMFASAAAGDPLKVTVTDYATDVGALVGALRKTTGAPCVWLAGHSEGALVAQLAASKTQGVCGLVLIAGAGRRISDVMRSQFAANPAVASYLPALNAAVASLEAGQKVDPANLPPHLQQVMFAPAVQDYLIDWMRHDPTSLLKAYKGPVLVLQGETDIQVSIEDAERLAGARPGVTKVVLPGVNHVLKSAPKDRAANVAAYADPHLPLAPGVADTIADFIKRH